MENALVETSRPLRLSGRLEVIRRYVDAGWVINVDENFLEWPTTLGPTINTIYTITQSGKTE